MGTLKRGEHKIILENVNGFNAVNIFVLIPEKDYIFEAESDLYRSNAKVIKDPKASNGEMLLFYENGKAWQDVGVVKNGTYRLALRGYGDFKVTIANHTFHIHSNGNYSYTPLFLLKRGEYNLTITPAKFANLLYNPSFELVSKGKPVGWKLGSKKFEIMLDKGYRGKYSLKVVTSATKGWSWIYCRAIDVKPGKKYLIVTHMKVYNAKASHIPVEGYFMGKGWKEIIQIPSGKAGTGTHGWREYSTILKIPENVTKIRVVLNAGWVLNKNKGKAITWFDDIKVIPLDKAPKLDVVWLYSTKENKTIQQLFEVKKKPAKIISYEKINPTLWKVQVQAKKPFMLSFAEAYDPLWEARVYKDGKLVEKVKSIPPQLYYYRLKR